VGGFSVTAPHKTAARRWVGTGAGATAVRTGAVNTLVFTAGKKATGYNTDSDAALDSITSALGGARKDLAGLSADVLGAGGAARAVIAALQACGCRVTVFGRSPERTSRLAKQFDAEARPWDQRVKRRGEMLVNCTTVGMWPAIDESPMPADALAGCKLVFDVVYNPLETRLLRDATSAGAPTLRGLDMFIRQAAKQLEYWTGVRPDIESARQLVTQEILDRQRRE
jgi:shikimate dehydrogenase